MLYELTKKDRKLLKKLISTAKKFDNKIIPPDKYASLSGDYHFRNLSQKRLIIEKHSPYDPDPGQATLLGLAVSEDGYHYFEKYNEYKHQQFLNGVIWPIIVATITSVIANTPNWLPWLLRLIQKWE